MIVQIDDTEISFFYLHQPHRPAQRPKTGLSVIGDEPCKLNGTTQALGEPVEVNHLRRTIHRVPRGSHPPDRPGGLTLPLRPSASHHRQRIPARQLSEDYLVPDNLGQHPGPGLVTPTYTGVGPISSTCRRPACYTGWRSPAGRV